MNEMQAEVIIRPGYIDLYRSGDLERRAEVMEARLASCDICPRECRINRLEGETKFCHSGCLPVVSAACAHHGEEPVLSGNQGSGTIFFGNCNLRCVYCQNHQITQDYQVQQHNVLRTSQLAEKMLYLQDKGCHNINLVSPSHFVPQIVRALVDAVPLGLKLPLVYNTNSYDSSKTLKELDGIIDIYLADLRYSSDKWGRKYSQVPDYVSKARGAIKEMYRQAGNLVVDNEGIGRRGLIVRCLILPSGLAGVPDSLDWLAGEISPSVTVSVMSQYYPAYCAPRIPLLSRKISTEEYQEVVTHLRKLRMENGWLQELSSPENYLPSFTQNDHPFNRVACREKGS